MNNVASVLILYLKKVLHLGSRSPPELQTSSRMDYVTVAEEDDSSDRQSYYCQKYANAITPKPPSFANADPGDKAPHPTNKTETETTVNIYYNTQAHPFHCTEQDSSRLAGFATLVELQGHCGAKHSAAALGLWCQPCCLLADDRTKMQ